MIILIMMECVENICDFFIKKSPELITLIKLIYFIFIIFVGIILSTAEYYKWGNLFGEIAVLIYLVSLVPGIFQRFGINHSVITVVRVYRRHIGISMFLFALSHMIIKRFPVFVVDFSTIPTFELMGTISLMIFLLLFITSNNLSQKILGVGWVYLQKLTYVGMLFVFLHLALVGSVKWGVLLWITIVVELVSFYVAATRHPIVE